MPIVPCYHALLSLRHETVNALMWYCKKFSVFIYRSVFRCYGGLVVLLVIYLLDSSWVAIGSGLAKADWYGMLGVGISMYFVAKPESEVCVLIMPRPVASQFWKCCQELPAILSHCCRAPVFLLFAEDVSLQCGETRSMCFSTRCDALPYIWL